MKVYVDTSAFIAFRDASDSYHPLFARLFSDPPALMTSPLVLAEGQAWFLKRYDANRALQFMNFIESLKGLVIKPVGNKEVDKATEYLRKFSDQKITLADAVGLYFMNHLKINLCWSTDHHLGLTRVPLVIHQTA